MNIRELSDRLGLDDEDFIVLLEMLISTAEKELSDLSLSIDENRMADAANLAHSLKGSAGNLGFMEFASVAETIEKKVKSTPVGSLKSDIDSLSLKFDQIKTLLKGL